MDNANSLLMNCQILRNVSGGGAGSYGAGGGVYMIAGAVSNCLILSNIVQRLGVNFNGRGAGMYMSAGVVWSSTIGYNWNSNGYYGGGVYLAGGLLSGCAIVSNQIAQWGGGVYQNGVSTTANCIVQGNLGNQQGGGVSLMSSNAICRNSLLVNNQSYQGGGFYLTNGFVESCTIAGNSAENYGGGIYNTAPGVQGITNSVFFGNKAGLSAAADDIYQPSDTLFGFCRAKGLTPGSNGNITNSPLFVDTGSGYGTNGVAGNYRLTAPSPCANTGMNQAWMDAAFDLDGRRRVGRDGKVDMGAYEFLPRGTMFRIQ